MIYGLTDEQTMIADTVRSFVEHEIYPHEELVERTGEVPAEIAQEIKQKTLDLAPEYPDGLRRRTDRPLPDARRAWRTHGRAGDDRAGGRIGRARDEVQRGA